MVRITKCSLGPSLTRDARTWGTDEKNTSWGGWMVVQLSLGTPSTNATRRRFFPASARTRHRNSRKRRKFICRGSLWVERAFGATNEVVPEREGGKEAKEGKKKKSRNHHQSKPPISHEYTWHHSES